MRGYDVQPSGDTAGTSADVHKTGIGRGVIPDQVDSLLNKDFRFRTGNQNRRGHLESQTEKLLFARQVLKRLPIGAAIDHAAQAIPRGIVHFLLCVAQEATLSQPSTNPSNRSAVRAGESICARFSSSKAHARTPPTVCINSYFPSNNPKTEFSVSLSGIGFSFRWLKFNR